jgi:hypothetical protein
MQKTIKQASEEYEAVKIKNIADLPEVSVDVSIEEKTFKEGTKDEFSLFVANLNGEDYRVPKIVLKNLKAILKSRPDLKKFKVDKQGEGKNGTTYTVIPL